MLPRTAALAVLGLALGSAAITLVVADRTVGRLVDPRFAPLAGPPGTHSTLVRTEFRVPVRTNAAGFRGQELPGPKPSGTFRIVVLGDSFTWGYGVRERQAYPARLARLLTARSGRPVEVVNLGLPGAGPLDYLHVLRRAGAALAPDLVLVGLFANDVNDLYQVRRYGSRSALYTLDAVRGAGPRSWWKRAAETVTPNLYVLASRAAARLGAGPRVARADAPLPPPARAVRPPEEVLAAVGDRYRRRDAILAGYRALSPADRAAVDGLIAGVPPADDMRPVVLLAALVDPEAERDGLLLRSSERRAAWRETANVLRQIVATARGAGARTVLAVLPASEQVNQARWPYLRAAGFRLDPAMLVQAPLRDGVGAVAAREGAGFVDLVHAFRRRRATSLYFQADEHWKPQGHALAAARLAEAILPEVR